MLVDAPSTGRIFTTSRRVSVADGDVGGRMELDAIARFLQDAGNDDTDDAELPELGLAWVARRALLEVRQWPTTRELLSMRTWCSGTGRRWAERRTSLVGERGGRVDAAVIWVHLDPTTGRPMAWGEEFAAAYLEATQERRVDAKLRHDKTPPPESNSTDWRFRQTDMDTFGHVNNAAYLAIAEELSGLDGAPVRVEVEWRGPSTSVEPLIVDHTSEHAGAHRLWVRSTEDGSLRVTMTVSAIPDEVPDQVRD